LRLPRQVAGNGFGGKRNVSPKNHILLIAIKA